MKIAVNTRLLLPGKLEGIGWFTCQTFKRIVRSHPEITFYFLFDRPYSREFVFSDNVIPVKLFPQARHPLLYYLYFEYAVRHFLQKEKADLFVSPDGFLSKGFDGPQLPVFHDLNFMHKPRYVPYLTGKYYTHFFPKYAAVSTRIATVSEYSKHDIVNTFNYPASRVDVVYNGIHEVFEPVDDAVKAATRKSFTGGSPYFVYIGALHKRKNIDSMLRAFDVFRRNDTQNHKLLIVGAQMFGSGNLKQVFQAMQFKNDVVFTGRQFEESLKNIVASARALLLVSHFEGFGIPIIEAMQCDVPVIASNVTSMPEVAGDAALLVEPDSVGQIADAMHRMVNDNVLVNDLVHKGRVQSGKFSWDRTAKLMWQSMERCL
ncbi:MAG: glycosyltransferase family 1 protein [Bacteroidales bacterium]|nr:glycosyltransferase family 1 protein [Bacteroidales bacterium]